MPEFFCVVFVIELSSYLLLDTEGGTEQPLPGVVGASKRRLPH